MRVFKGMLICFITVLNLFSSPYSFAKTVVPVYTPGTGGAGYIIGGAMAVVLNKYIPDIQVMVEATGGTLAMSKYLGEKYEKKQPAFGHGDSKMFHMAFTGQPPFKKAIPSLRAVTFQQGAGLALVVANNSPIQSYYDLKGKRVGIGAAGSGTSQISTKLIEGHGLLPSMYQPLWLGYAEVVEGIKDNSIDAGFIAGAYPVPALQQLALEKDVRVIPVDEEVLKKVLAVNPYFYREGLKPGSYRGITKETPILVFGAVLETHIGVDEDLVYKITKTMFEHREELLTISPQLKAMTLQNARKTITTPFHPGAAKYYKEKGVME